MKFCVECGCELEGNEKICPECGYDLDTIKVNRRKGDRAVFESSFLQSLSDQLDIFIEDASNVLNEFDTNDFKKQFEDIDVVDIKDQTLDQLSDLKDETMESLVIDDFLDKTTKNTRMALNRDKDYLNNAKRKFKSLNSNYRIDYEKTNLRIVQLCDKAIDLNETNPEAYYLKGLALVNLKRYASAIDEFINTLALDENDLDARLAIANSNRLNGEFDDAINVYDSVLKMDNDSFEAYKGKAIVYYDMDDYSNANIINEKANNIESLEDEDLKLWESCKN